MENNGEWVALQATREPRLHMHSTVQPLQPNWQETRKLQEKVYVEWYENRRGEPHRAILAIYVHTVIGTIFSMGLIVL